MPAATLDDLVLDLARDLAPVRRLRPPLWRACAWLCAVAGLGAMFACGSDLSAIAARIVAAPDMWLALAGSVATTVLGAIAVFQLSCPDRSVAWSLLPLPTLALWLGASGVGCLRGPLGLGPGPAAPDDMRDCATFIIVLSVPLSCLMVLMVRRACPLRPNLTAVVGGLAAAAGCASLLTFIHPHDASLADLLVHIGAVAVVIGLNSLFGGRLLAAGLRSSPGRTR